MKSRYNLLGDGNETAKQGNQQQQEAWPKPHLLWSRGHLIMRVKMDFSIVDFSQINISLKDIGF